MALVPRVAMAACTLAVLLQAGCLGRATHPNVTNVGMSLTVSPAVGGPSHPVVADVRVRNVGNTRVGHCEGCGCGNGIAFSVLGPDGAEVWLRDPNARVPGCQNGFSPLEPGRELSERLVFTGTLYEPGSRVWPTPTYSAPPGTYTVVARFSYSTRVPEEWFSLERRATFVWAP